VNPTSYWKAPQLDASAAVKLVAEEAGSAKVRRYFSNRSGFFITGLCLAEALSVLKRKFLRRELTQDQYFAACYVLLAYIRENRIHIEEIDLGAVDVFRQAEDFSRRCHLDLSDSLQLVTVKHGRFRHYAQESKTILITADADLASAAKAEGLRVWNCELTETPPNQ
jgi:predicted nucleic acid-binding protein